MAKGKYKVVGRHTVFGVKPGSVLDLSEIHITGDELRNLLGAGHLEEVQDELPVETEVVQAPTMEPAAEAAPAE